MFAMSPSSLVWVKTFWAGDIAEKGRQLKLKRMICKNMVPFFSVLFLIACNNNKERILSINDTINAQGHFIIERDTIYQGLIKFYDKRNGKLIQQANYLNGIEDGKRTDYYKNGEIAAVTDYSHGHINGESKAYDENGRLTLLMNFYYDLQVGPVMTYANDSLVAYSFHSFEGEPLMFLEYDSLIYKPITKMVTDFFFFKKRNLIEVFDYGVKEQKSEYFVYTPHPPKYNFRYSLVIIDDNYKEEKTIQSLNNKTSWSNFSLTESLESTNHYALKLLIFDSIVGGDITMLKKLT
jgi:antitoxin component YwqK of YwqJK toxin-antitoxin module